jgi:small GTP-binding protein
MANNTTFFRVVLVGDSLVGKTSIVHALVRGEFDPNDVPTVGAVFHTVARDVHGKRLVMQLWDTAGTEKYRSIGPIYYRNAAAALAVFDLRNDNFTEGLDGWIVNVKRNSVDPLIFIVGNKVDLVQPTVETFERVKAFADIYSAQFFLVSAKNGDNIKMLFDAVFEGLYKSIVTPMGIAPEEVQPELTPLPPSKCC